MDYSKYTKGQGGDQKYEKGQGGDFEKYEKSYGGDIQKYTKDVAESSLAAVGSDTKAQPVSLYTDEFVQKYNHSENYWKDLYGSKYTGDNGKESGGKGGKGEDYYRNKY